MTSCTAVLDEVIRGGHSPMMQLDGKWNIDKNQKIENGTTTEVDDADRVWFNATKDIGDYCEGTWLETNIGADPKFLWGIDEKGTEFVINDPQAGEQTWVVEEQSKNKFIISRQENGTTYRMEFSK